MARTAERDCVDPESQWWNRDPLGAAIIGAVEPLDWEPDCHETACFAEYLNRYRGVATRAEARAALTYEHELLLPVLCPVGGPEDNELSGLLPLPRNG